MLRRRALLGGLAAGVVASTAHGQTPVLRIGVLGDPTGIGINASGRLTALVARMAVADFGPLPDGTAVEVLADEFRLKPDDALAIARRWFDQDDVTVLVDVPTAAAAEAVQALATQRGRTLLDTSSINPALSGRLCSPLASQWADDSQTLANAVVRGLSADGARRWYLMVPDTPVSLAIQRDAERAIEAAGGRVLGLSRYPSGATDLASPVALAKQSGADAIGLCGINQDLRTALQQGQVHGLAADGRRLAGFVVALNDVHAAGAAAAGLHLASSFYWDSSGPSRSFAGRVLEAGGRMPEQAQAATYAAIQHCLRAVAATGSLDAATINLEMRKAPVYFFALNARLRLDGRMVRDITLYRVKPLAGRQSDWDCYEPVRVLPAAQIFPPLTRGGCPLVP